MYIKISLVFVFLFSLLCLQGDTVFAASNSAVNKITPIAAKQNILKSNFLEVIANTEGRQQTIDIPTSELLFNIIENYDEKWQNIVSLSIGLKPELFDLYNKLGLFANSKDYVFVYPIFTQAAYQNGGFYYYNNRCDSRCLTVTIPVRSTDGTYSSSIIGAHVLKELGYSVVTDSDVDQNPGILKQYKRVIILHNEYVTNSEFNAITHHPNVIYLYPNALYAEVSSNYNTGTITLV